MNVCISIPPSLLSGKKIKFLKIKLEALYWHKYGKGRQFVSNLRRRGKLYEGRYRQLSAEWFVTCRTRMVNRRSSCIIKLENFENAEALIENYKREFEIHRLHETLESMLVEEDESISSILNGAYGDYSLISTELLPLIDSFLPSIKQFQEKIDTSLGQVSSLVERYSEDFGTRISRHGQYFIKKLELNLFKICHDEINKYRETLLITRGQFNGDEARTAFLSVRLVHFCILRLLKIKESIDGIYATISKMNVELGLELERNKHYNDCFELCDRFFGELRDVVIKALGKLLQTGGDREGPSGTEEDLGQSDNLLLQCVFLLGLKDELVGIVNEHVRTEVVGSSSFGSSAAKDDKLLFSNAICDLEHVIRGEKLAGFIRRLVFSMFSCGSTEYLRFAIDVYVRGVLLFLLEHVEREYSDHIIPPTAPMDLFLHQLNSLVSLIEQNERILIDHESSRLSGGRLKEVKLKILTCFRENYYINSYSKRWKFGTYWNLVYRNILNRRISIRNEPVEFSKVYVYDNKKYWLKYTIEIIRQIRWILGNSSIHSSAPLPPSRYLVPLFTRCLYSSLSLLYDHSNYLLSFTELSHFSENDSGKPSVWSPKTKPEHVCCILMDAVSFQEWVRLHFVNEVFFHIDKVEREFGLGESFDLAGSEGILDVGQLKLVVEEELINRGYLAHVSEQLLRPLADTMSLCLKNQTVRVFEPGLRAVPCLYRLTSTATLSKNADGTQTGERVPSSYVENATKPIEVFLIFSLNAIKSIITDLSTEAVQGITRLYYDILAGAFEQIFGEIFDLCEKQILSSKHQLASLQKLAQKSIEGPAANRIDPSMIASQYMTDIDTWLTRVFKLLANFFGNLDKGSEKQVTDYISAVKGAPNYVKLYKILESS